MGNRFNDPTRPKMSEFILTELGRLENNSLILDAGAGDPAYHVRDPRHQYVAFDYCIGQDDWDYSAINAVGTLEFIPFKTDAFDGIICTQTLEHVAEPEAVLKELFRVLKPGCKLFLTVPQEWYLHQIPHDYYRFTKYGLSHIFKKAGFDVQSIEPMGGYFLFMAHRVALFHRFFFPPIKSLLLRVIRKPVKEFIVFLFGDLLPGLLVKMDKYDTERYVTLGYKVVGIKNVANQ